jgi:hypothetical protein
MKDVLKLVLLFLVSAIVGAGCRLTINSYCHRGQMGLFTNTNGVPESLNFENLQEGLNAEVKDNTGAKVF